MRRLNKGILLGGAIAATCFGLWLGGRGAEDGGTPRHLTDQADRAAALEPGQLNRMPRFAVDQMASAGGEAARVLADPSSDSRDVFWAYKTEVCACSDYACFAALGNRYTDKLATAALVSGEAEDERVLFGEEAAACIAALKSNDRTPNDAVMHAQRQAQLMGAARVDGLVERR